MSYHTVLAIQSSASEKDAKVTTVAIYKINDQGYMYYNIANISLIIISRSLVYSYVELCKWAWCVDTLYVCMSLYRLHIFIQIFITFMDCYAKIESQSHPTCDRQTSSFSWMLQRELIPFMSIPKISLKKTKLLGVREF